MSKYTKTTTTVDGKQTVQYMDGKNPVSGKDVPEVVRTALNEVKEGTIIDELGDVFDPETDLDESGDETATEVTNNDDEINEDDLDEDDEDQQTPAPKAPEKAEKPAPKPRATRRKDTDDGSGEEGMGFPRVNGKTVDIFDGKTPHTHIKNVAGLVVPLSEESFNTKTDVEIMEKLKEIGKI